jgi:hypothetical protein
MASQVFTASGTWNWPVGTTSVIVECIGGGGGGGTASGNPATGGGGKGGSYAKSVLGGESVRLAVAEINGGSFVYSYYAGTDPRNHGQTFSNMPGQLTKLSLLLGKLSGYVQNDSVYVVLHADTFDGAVIAQSAMVAASAIPFSPLTWIDFVFPTPPTLGAGTYAFMIGLTRAVADTSSYLQVSMNSPNSYVGGSWINNGVIDTSVDLSFRLYGFDFSLLTIAVGAGGVVAGSGAPSSVVQSGATVCLAPGGNGGGSMAGSSANGIAGTGLNGTAVGTTFVGGDGGQGAFAAGSLSGAGGGAAGPTGNGGAATGGTAGIAGTGTFQNGLTYQAAGRAGVGDTTAGAAGTAYGGGASGGKANSNTDKAGGVGGGGVVVLTWVALPQDITGDTRAAASVVNPPTVVAAGPAQPVTTLPITTGLSLNVPTVAPGPRTITGASLVTTVVVRVPTIAPGPVTGIGVTIPEASQMFALTVVRMTQVQPMVMIA